MIESSLKHIIRDLMEHGKSVSIGEIKDDCKGLLCQSIIKASIEEERKL